MARDHFHRLTDHFLRRSQRHHPDSKGYLRADPEP